MTTARPSITQASADALVMAQRELTATIRKPALVFLAFIQPVMFLLLFRYVFGGAIETPQGAYVDFLLPGLLVQLGIFGALFTGMGLTEDLSRGTVDRFRSLPMARSAQLVGRTLSDLLRNTATLLAVLAVGILVGFRPSEPLHRIALGLGLVLAFGYVFSWIAATVALLVRDPETVQSAGFAWIFPLTFISSAFVPTETMPGAVRWFAEVNPMTFGVDAVRALMIGGEAGPATVRAGLWLAALLIVFSALAVRRYRNLG